MKPLAAAALAAALSLTAGAAHAGARSFDLTGFDKVEASNHVRVIVRQGPYSVTVDEPDNRFEDLRLSVQNGVLIASRRDRYSMFGAWDRPDFTITVTLPAVTALYAHDHARLTANVTAPSLRINAADHGRLDGEISAGKLEATARDHGHVSYRGRCQELTASADDHGGIDGADMQCDLATAKASGHGGLSVHAIRTISCRAYDHGGIRVLGPAKVESWISSDHGSIRRG